MKNKKNTPIADIVLLILSIMFFLACTHIGYERVYGAY